MTVLNNIRDAVVAHLQSVPDAGAVHAWQRYADDSESLKALYSATIDGQPQLRGWHVSRIATSETEPVPGRRALTCTWLLQGYMEWFDAAQSEIVFDDLIEAVCGVFRDDASFGGGIVTTVFDDEDGFNTAKAGVQVVEIAPTQFAGMRCHAVRLELTTRHYLDIHPQP